MATSPARRLASYRVWIVALLVTFSMARVSSAWDYVTPTATGYPASVLFDGIGGVISLGDHGSDLVVARHSGASGVVSWTYVLDQSGVPLTSTSLAPGPGGLILAAGHRGRDNASFSSALVLLRPRTGSPAWRVDLPGVGIFSVATDPDGDVVAAGRTVGTRPGDSDDQDLLAVKLSAATGEELWRFTLDGGGDLIDARDGEMTREVAIDAAGDAYLVGHVVQNQTLGYPDFTVLKLAGSDGTLIWQHTVLSVAGHGGTAWGISLTSEGDVVATGQAVLANGWCDIVTTKLAAADGNEVWRYVLDTGLGRCDASFDVTVDASDDVLVAAAPDGVTLFSVLKLSGASGAEFWRRDLPNAGACLGGECAAGVGVTLDPEGNVIALGRVANSPLDMSVAKLSPSDGSVLWRRDLDLDGCDDVAWSFDVDALGDIVVAGAGFLKVAGQCAWPQGANLHVAKLTGVSGKDFWLGCHDDLDNDWDGFIDLEDPECSNPQDLSEFVTPASCGLGPEIALVGVASLALRRHRQRRASSA